ncbi:hypothetical protein ALC57_05306 [Trachymyrmex cornetzi]|uniref:Uncharacterized protein n=1 Tax=Trachymyrmex cornetzi TaxID=471704 RepID=A0A151JBA1_9HYME|nr:hypothetical protein ALC57_05306 [Trachymyrmex cornetzi]
MREVGRVIRTYASNEHTNRIVPRLETVINATIHSSTGYAPDVLHQDGDIELNIHPDLKPNRGPVQSREERIEEARENLRKAAAKRLKQFNKTTTAPQYREGDLVWCKLHRRSDANGKLTRKIHLVYRGPYRIRRVVRMNAYEIEDMDRRSIGVYNSRQLRPHRESRLRGEYNGGRPEPMRVHLMKMDEKEKESQAEPSGVKKSRKGDTKVSMKRLAKTDKENLSVGGSIWVARKRGHPRKVRRGGRPAKIPRDGVRGEDRRPETDEGGTLSRSEENATRTNSIRRLEPEILRSQEIQYGGPEAKEMIDAEFSIDFEARQEEPKMVEQAETQKDEVDPEIQDGGRVQGAPMRSEEEVICIGDPTKSKFQGEGKSLELAEETANQKRQPSEKIVQMVKTQRNRWNPLLMQRQLKKQVRVPSHAA